MENKFEKNVQRAMEDLEFTPSAFVWQQVEKRIQLKNRRRVFLWLFSMASTGVITAFFLYYLNTGSHANSHQNVTKESRFKADEIPDNGSFETRISALSPGKTSVNSALSKAATISPVKRSSSSPVNNANSIHYIETKATEDPKSEESILPKRNGDDLKRQHIGPSEEENVEKTTTIEKPDSTTMDQLFPNPASGSRNNPGIEKLEIVESNSKDVQLKNGFEIGFSITPGVSFMSKGFLELTKSLENSDYMNNPGTGQNNGNPPVIPVSAPRFRQGHAFSTGISVIKTISARTQLETSLQYQYVSISQNVSQTGSFANYFSGSGTFNNRLHFISLPLNFRIADTAFGLPINWEAGVVVSRLVSANALQYDGNRYFKDNSLFQKTQIGAQAGISVTLLDHEKFKFSVGPYYHYSFHQLTKKGAFSRYYLNFAGIKAQISLKNKR